MAWKPWQYVSSTICQSQSVWPNKSDLDEILDRVQKNDDNYVQRNEEMPEWIPRESQHLSETRTLMQTTKMEFSEETED